MLYLFLKKAVVLTLPGIQILVSSSTSATYVLITDFITVAAAIMLLLLLPVLFPASVKRHRYCNYSNIKRKAQAAVCDTQLPSIRCRVFLQPVVCLICFLLLQEMFPACSPPGRCHRVCYIIVWMSFASVTCHVLLLVLD